MKRQTPVCKLLSFTLVCRGRLDPGKHLNGETIYSPSLLVDGCHSVDHILAIQWAFVSLGRVVDMRSFPIVAKGRRNFSPGCVMEEVILVHAKSESIIIILLYYFVSCRDICQMPTASKTAICCISMRNYFHNLATEVYL